MKKLNKKCKEKFTISPWTLKKPLYLKKSDKRYKSHVIDLKKYGFSNAETWSLYSCVCEFILPRLKRFKEIKMAFPFGIKDEEWDIILDKMIFSFEWAMLNEEGPNLKLTEKENEENWKRFEEGMNLFAKWFMSLWW